MKSTNKSLIEATIVALDELQKRVNIAPMRKNAIKGVGAKAIHSTLQTAQLDNRSLTNLDIRLQSSDVFDALCTSIESISIFKYEGADANDIYFSLRGPVEQMLEIARKIEHPAPLNPKKYEIPTNRVDLSSFNNLCDKIERSNRQHKSLQTRNDELQRTANNLQQQYEGYQNPYQLQKTIMLLNL